jgi:hypothetical protein
LRNLARSLLKRPNCLPKDLVMAEFRGAIHGPMAYLRSRRRLLEEQREPLEVGT